MWAFKLLLNYLREVVNLIKSYFDYTDLQEGRFHFNECNKNALLQNCSLSRYLYNEGLMKFFEIWGHLRLTHKKYGFYLMKLQNIIR